MKQQSIIITIDGPAGTGKSTVAHQLARRLGLDFLDTGAMYRAAALIAIDQEIDPNNGEHLAASVTNSSLKFDWESDPPRLLLDGRDISTRIREMDVSEIVSIVAAQRFVRDVLVELQRIVARDHPRLVSEGRDQGSVVFPSAVIKFYMDADLDVRAQRRLDQLTAVGNTVDRDRIVKDILERDQLDQTREEAPLVCPDGAITVDTTNKTADEVIDHLESMARARLQKAGLSL